jgi:hypothetical protein
MSTQTSSSSKLPPTPPTSTSDLELEKLLSREASAFQRELEVERILKAFKLKYLPSIHCLSHTKLILKYGIARTTS